MIGRTIGNYVVKKQIGQGGMGVVYLAEHPRINRAVAIKVLHPHLNKDPATVRRFFTEARAASDIRQENIIDILDFGELEDGACYFAMEWLDGRSLKDVLAGGRLSTTRAVHVMRGVCRALEAAHSHAVVHRDLKPDNVYLVPRDGAPELVKVLDFGVAKLLEDESVNVTQTGQIVGTPSYMSPEQCRGLHDQIDERSDLYSLGVMSYQMVTGGKPFKAETLGDLLLAHMTAAPVPPRQIVPEVPAALEAIILQLLEKEPDKRFPTAGHVLLALAPLGEPSAEAVSTRTPVMRKRYRSRSRRALWATVGVMTGCAAIAGGAFLALRDRRPVAAEPAKPIARPASPSTVQVKLRTIPPSATITLDGARIDNPIAADFPHSDQPRRLVIQAPGFLVEDISLAFDEPIDLTVKLVPGEGTHEVKAQPKPARPAEGHRPLPAAPAGTDPTARPPALPAPPTTPPPTTTPSPPSTPEVKPEDRRPVRPGAHTDKPSAPDDKPIYKGTKGKLITDFPE